MLARFLQDITTTTHEKIGYMEYFTMTFKSIKKEHINSIPSKKNGAFFRKSPCHACHKTNP